jgi:hypothetical protein
MHGSARRKAFQAMTAWLVAHCAAVQPVEVDESRLCIYRTGDSVCKARSSCSAILSDNTGCAEGANVASHMCRMTHGMILSRAVRVAHGSFKRRAGIQAVQAQLGEGCHGESPV